MKEIKNDQSIALLNRLIEVHNDRCEGYCYAAKKVDGFTMKLLFARLAETSNYCGGELCSEVKKMGGLPAAPAKAPARDDLWENLGSAIADNNWKAIFQSCELKEMKTAEVYEAALTDSKTTEHDYRDFIDRQLELIRSDQEKIKNLREAFIKV